MKFLITSIFFLMISVNGVAQVEFKSLDQCIKYAFQNHPGLQNEKLAEDAAHQKRIQTTSALLPQLKAFTSFDDYLSLPVQLIPAEIFGGQPGEFVSVAFGTQYNLSYGLEASVPLIDFQRQKNHQISRIQERSAHYQKLNAYQKAMEDIARTYYITLLSHEAVKISHENALSNDTLLASAQSKFNNGLIETLEYNRIKALHLESQQALSDNEAVFARNVSLLKALCGIAPETGVILSETPEVRKDEPVMIKGSIEQYAGYQSVQWKIRQFELEMNKQKLRWAPEVSAYGRYTRQAMRDDFSFFEANRPWFEIGVVGIKIDMPLFTGFHRSSSLKLARINREMAENDLKNYTLQTQKELEQLSVNFHNAESGVSNYQTHYELNTESYRLAMVKYRQGVYSIDQLLQVYAEKLKSQHQYLNKMADYFTNKSIINIKNESLNPENKLFYEAE